MKMKTILRQPILAVALLGSLAASGLSAAVPTPEDVKAITKKVADWQIATFADMGKYRALAGRKVTKHRNREPYHDLVWPCGALYAGMNQWRKIADDSAKYTDWLTMIGRRNGWKLPTPSSSTFVDVDHIKSRAAQPKRHPGACENMRT